MYASSAYPPLANETASHVAIIGAGYAGLAAAVELARADIPCSVFEASQTLGGRARVVDKDGYRIDNGQHILIGAYSETLKMLRFLGVSPKRLEARPFFLHIPGQIDLRTAALPSPFNLAWGLLKAKGLSWTDRRGAAGFIRYLKKNRFRIVPDRPVSDLLKETRQTPRLKDLIWEPLCVAALNTPIHQASAQVFANVLRDTLAAGSAAAELLLPRTDLSELFPVPAVRYLAQKTCPVHTLTPIKHIVPQEHGFKLEADPFKAIYSHVIIATAPFQVGHLIAEIKELQQLRQQLDNFAYEPICTVYLAYQDSQLRLPQPMIGCTDSPVQWIFDRGQLGGPAALFAGVISASGPHTALSRDELALQMHSYLELLFPKLAPPIWSQVITEKRATFACRPNMLRPIARTAVRNVLLAGDYTDSHYPATIESAIRSGLYAAQHVKRLLFHA